MLLQECAYSYSLIASTAVLKQHFQLVQLHLKPSNYVIFKHGPILLIILSMRRSHPKVSINAVTITLLSQKKKIFHYFTFKSKTWAYLGDLFNSVLYLGLSSIVYFICPTKTAFVSHQYSLRSYLFRVKTRTFSVSRFSFSAA